MPDQRETRHLYVLLMELPKNVREEIVVEEFELAHGKEPEGDTERANWYRVALGRLVQPSFARRIRTGNPGPEFEDVLGRVQEEVAARREDPAKEVGVLDG